MPKPAAFEKRLGSRIKPSTWLRRQVNRRSRVRLTNASKAMKPINLTGKNSPAENWPQPSPREPFYRAWNTRLSAKAQSIIVCLLLAMVTFAVFSQALKFDFVNFDDPKYVTENSNVLHGLSAKGLAWAFTSQHASN